MKRCQILVVATGVALLLSAAAQGQVEQGKFYLGPVAGVALPFGDLADAAKVGFALGATGDYMVSPNAAIGADVVMNFFGGKDFEEFDGEETIKWSEKYRITQITAHGKLFFSPEKTTIPYISGGAGFYNLHYSLDYNGPSVPGFVVGGSASDTKFGINGGGGVLLNAGQSMKLSIGGAVHVIFGDGSTATYVNAGAALLFPLGG